MFLSFNDYVLLYEPAPGVPLKEVLTRALGVPAVVDKRREIFFIEHVKFHLDREQLQRQCASYLVRFEILPKDLAPVSYEAFSVYPKTSWER